MVSLVLLCCCYRWIPSTWSCFGSPTDHETEVTRFVESPIHKLRHIARSSTCFVWGTIGMDPSIIKSTFVAGSFRRNSFRADFSKRSMRKSSNLEKNTWTTGRAAISSWPSANSKSQVTLSLSEGQARVGSVQRYAVSTQSRLRKRTVIFEEMICGLAAQSRARLLRPPLPGEHENFLAVPMR